MNIAGVPLVDMLISVADVSRSVFAIPPVSGVCALNSAGTVPVRRS